MAFLLDTSVASELTKRHPDPAVGAWLDSVPGPSLYLSVLVVGEVREGIERIRGRDPAKAAIFESWLARLEHGFADRIIPVDTQVAREWGAMHAATRLPVVDGLIAATARVHGWTVVTRNTKDFAPTGVRVLDPFDWPA